MAGQLVIVVVAVVASINALPPPSLAPYKAYPSLAPYKTYLSLAPYNFGVVLERLHLAAKGNFTIQPKDTAVIKARPLRNKGSGYTIQPKEPGFTIQPKDTAAIKTRPLRITYTADFTLECKKSKQVAKVNPGESVQFSSINYPANYNKKSKCKWQIKGKTDTTRISISCDAFQLQKANKKGKCSDALIINGNKYCGSDYPVYSSDTNIVNMSFKSNKKKQYSGFTCTATAYDDSLTTTVKPTTTTTITTTTAEPTVAPTGSPTCQCGRVNRQTRIINGQETEVLEYPWQAGLVGYGSSRTFCGGSLINNKWVLTAAHCTDGTSPSQIQVLLGEHTIYDTDATEERFSVTQVINHPSYITNPWNNGHDVSLLELSGEVDFSSTQIRPICLPSTADLFAGAEATVTGWGTTNSGSQSLVLMEVDIPVVTNTVCENTYGPSNIDNTMICAGEGAGNGACMGDSGGPLITSLGDYHVQIGVVSFGSSNCDALGVYARVTALKSWIKGYAMAGSAEVCSP